MIKIEQGEINTVVVTVTEKTTINSPTYLFSILDKQKNTYKNFIVSDVSTSTDRYNEFLIEEVGNGTEDLNDQKIKLSLTGSYDYTIYAQSSTTNTNPSLADEVVEVGMIRVIGDSEVSYTEPSDDSDTYSVSKDE